MDKVKVIKDMKNAIEFILGYDTEGISNLKKADMLNTIDEVLIALNQIERVKVALYLSCPVKYYNGKEGEAVPLERLEEIFGFCEDEKQ